ncbi:MAG: hypothetical protein J6D53_11150 [Blautia sp.]|nr:hypothetical protein [Blautia sp.]
MQCKKLTAFALFVCLSFSAPQHVKAIIPNTIVSFQNNASGGILSSEEDIGLWSSDGANYYFTYNGTEFHAEHRYDSWVIYSSYRIINASDIEIICSALSREHPVPSIDYTSYRTPSDMALEWIQHNIVYYQLPEGSHWREHAMTVCLDPEDQGKTFQELYEDRTGAKLDNEELIEKIREKIKEYLGR